MVFKCVSHYSRYEDAEESGGEQISLAYTNCGSEPFTYVIVMVDCAGRLVVKAFYGSDQVAHKAACQTLSNAFLKSTKMW